MKQRIHQLNIGRDAMGAMFAPVWLSTTYGAYALMFSCDASSDRI